MRLWDEAVELADEAEDGGADEAVGNGGYGDEDGFAVVCAGWADEASTSSDRVRWGSDVLPECSW